MKKENMNPNEDAHLEVHYFPELSEVVLKGNEQAWKYIGNLAKDLSHATFDNNHIHIDESSCLNAGNVRSLIFVYRDVEDRDYTYLEPYYDKQFEEIVIRGNKKAWEEISDLATQLVNAKRNHGHHHLDDISGMTTEDTIQSLILEYLDLSNTSNGAT